jgi:uncharacterized protein
MKHLLILVAITTGFSAAAQTYSEQLQTERTANNMEMLFEVLDSAERKAFTGICYFDIDTAYIVGATFTKKKGKKFVMPMTKARTVYYRQYGILRFTLRDTVCELAVYENLGLKGQKEYKDYLFLPFRDGTTALTTYGGGRYLDVHKTKGKNWKIDFNRAYHPYCVYSPRYSCPIVPDGNTIAPHISAGECYGPHE